MPFFQRDQSGEVVDKFDVGLTQVRFPPHPLSNKKTWFQNQTEFWSANSAAVDPTESQLVKTDTYSDLASVPRFMWGVIPSYGRHTMPALVHDKGCDEAKGDVENSARLRRDADHHFRQNLIGFARTGLVRSWLMWSAVRLFGRTVIGVFALLTGLLGYTWLGCGLVPPAWPEWLDVVGSVAGWGALIAAVVLLGLIVWAGFERTAVQCGEAVQRLHWPAVGSMLGAAVIGVMAVGPLAPLVLVTAGTNVVISILDHLAGLVAPAPPIRRPGKHTEVWPTPEDREPEGPDWTIFPGP